MELSLTGDLLHPLTNFIKCKMKLEFTTNAVFKTLVFKLFDFSQPNVYYITRNKIDHQYSDLKRGCNNRFVSVVLLDRNSKII